MRGIDSVRRQYRHAVRHIRHTADVRLARFSHQVEEKVEELRELLPGERVAGVVSISPDLLFNDVQTCLRPRMTRLVAALTAVKGFQGTLDADKVTFTFSKVVEIVDCAVVSYGTYVLCVSLRVLCRRRRAGGRVLGICCCFAHPSGGFSRLPSRWRWSPTHGSSLMIFWRNRSWYVAGYHCVCQPPGS